jgi:hypothetical protein
MGESWGRRVRDYAAIALKCAAVIFCGMACQRMALAQTGDAAGVTVPALPRPGLGRIKLAQTDDNAIPEAQDTAPADVPVTPPATAPETLSVDRQFSPRHRRRKPRMAGVPSGTPMVVEPAEPAPQVAQEAAPVAAPVTQQPVVAQRPTTQATAKTGAAAAGEADEESETGEANAPGAVAGLKAEKEQRGLFERKYGLAHIRWGGTITESVGMSHLYTFAGLGVKLNAFAPATPSNLGAVGMTTTQRLQTVQVGGETYVMQPWIATVRGRFGLMSGRQSTSLGYDSSLSGVIGAGDVQFFNRSRFPVILGYTSTDSRSDANTSNVNVTTSTNGDTMRKKLSLTETYRSLDVLSKGEAYFVRDNVTTQQLETTPTPGVSNPALLTTDAGVTTTLSGNYSTKLGPSHTYPLLLNGTHTTYSGSSTFLGASSNNTSTSSRMDSLFGSHVYLPEDSLLTLRTNGNYISSNTTESWVSSLQLNSTATWQPEAEDNPLIVRGGVSGFNMNTGSPSAPTINDKGLNSNVLLTYNAWRDRRLSGGATVAATDSAGVTALSTTLFARGDYIPSVKRLKYGTYTQAYDTGFSHSTSSGSPQDLNVYAGATHSLYAPFSFDLLGRSTKGRSSLSQVLTVQHDQVYGASETLTSVGDVNWQPSLHKRVQVDKSKVAGFKEMTTANASAHLIIGVRASDSHTFGYDAQHTDAVTFSLGADGLGGFLARAAGYGATGSFNVNTTYEASVGARVNALASAAWGWGTKYDYTYKRPRAFGVRGLDYGLVIHASGNTSLAAQRADAIAAGVPRAGGTLQGYALNYGASLRQALRYRIGQNEAILKADASAMYGVKSASLMVLFRAWRNFGN